MQLKDVPGTIRKLLRKAESTPHAAEAALLRAKAGPFHGAIAPFKG